MDEARTGSPAVALPEDLSACHAVIHQLSHALQRKQRENEQLQHRLEQLLKARFGPRADRLDPNQLALFASEVIAEAQQAEPAATNPKEPAQRNAHGRKRLPADLPRERIVHDLPEDQRACPGCGCQRERIGSEISEQLELVPAKLYVIEHERVKYACKQCQGQVVIADKPVQPIEKGLAGPGLLAQVITGKYGDHLPLYRQEAILGRSGAHISRSTTCGWMASCASLVKPLVDYLTALMRLSRYINTDDTPVPVLEPGSGKTRTGRLWVYVGDAEHPYTVFDYTPTRNRDGPTQFFGDYAGYIQADAYGGYDHLFKPKGDGTPVPLEVGCWAHARRKFVEAESSYALRAHAAVALIQRLYALEAQAQEQATAQVEAEIVGAEVDERALAAKRRAALVAARNVLRHAQSLPQLAELKAWLDAQRVDVLPKSPLGGAVEYCLSNWTALTRYATDGELAIDNNAAENAIRPVALGRKNWLFAGSDAGGRTGATLMTLTASCKRHGVDPFAYLRDVLTRLAATPVNELDQFLPDRWKAAHPRAALAVIDA